MVTCRWRFSAIVFLLSTVCSAAAPRDVPLGELLGLSAEEESRFWPVYTEYRYEITKLRANRRQLVGNARDRAAALNTTQADEFVEGWLDNRRDEVELTERFVKRFRRFLSDVQVARLLLLELPSEESTQMPARMMEEK